MLANRRLLSPVLVLILVSFVTCIALSTAAHRRWGADLESGNPRQADLSPSSELLRSGGRSQWGCAVAGSKAN